MVWAVSLLAGVGCKNRLRSRRSSTPADHVDPSVASPAPPATARTSTRRCRPSRRCRPLPTSPACISDRADGDHRQQLDPRRDQHRHRAHPARALEDLPGRQAGDRRREQRLRLGAAHHHGATLWVDAGVTLYASRDPTHYQANKTADQPRRLRQGRRQRLLAPATSFITVSGASPAIVGDGIIDGQGGEPLIGHDYSWWQLSAALQTDRRQHRESDAHQSLDRRDRLPDVPNHAAQLAQVPRQDHLYSAGRPDRRARRLGPASSSGG